VGDFAVITRHAEEVPFPQHPKMKSGQRHRKSVNRSMLSRTPLLHALLACLCGTILPTSSAFAGSSAGAQITPAAPTGFPVTLEVSGQYEGLQQSAAGPSGDVWRSKAALPLYIPLSKHWRFTGGLSGAYSEYSSTPFSKDGVQLWDLGIAASLNGDLTDKWTASFGLIGSAGFEDGASFSDSLNGGGFASVGYRWSKTLKTSIGGLALSRNNEDALIVPTIGLDWQVSEGTLVRIKGLEARVQQRVSDGFDVFFRGEFDPGGALLKDRSNTPVTSFYDKGFRAGIGFDWNLNKALKLSVDGGVAFHEISTRDDNGTELSSEWLDPAPYASVMLTFEF
jgi:hypothetical protein